MATPYEIPHDTVYPRDEENRYRVYARDGWDLRVLATTPDPGGIGQALVTLHDDAKEAGQTLGNAGRIGVLDVLGGEDGRGEWIVLPWGNP